MERASTPYPQQGGQLSVEPAGVNLTDLSLKLEVFSVRV